MERDSKKKGGAKLCLKGRSKNKAEFCAQNNWTWLRGGERLWRIRCQRKREWPEMQFRIKWDRVCMCMCECACMCALCKESPEQKQKRNPQKSAWSYTLTSIGAKYQSQIIYSQYRIHHNTNSVKGLCLFDNMRKMLLVSLYLTQHVCSLQKSFILLFYCDASHFVWSQLIQTEVSQYVGLCPDSWLTSKLDFFLEHFICCHCL